MAVEKIEPVSADLVTAKIQDRFAAYVVQLLWNVAGYALGSEAAYWRQEWWTLVSVTDAVPVVKVAAAFQIHCSGVMKCSADLSFVVVVACSSNHFSCWTTFFLLWTQIVDAVDAKTMQAVELNFVDSSGSQTVKLTESLKAENVEVISGWTEDPMTLL